MKNAKEFAREHSYKIPMLDASVIYRLNASGSGLKLYERAKNSKGNEKYKPNTALFSGALKYCLETEKLESVYKESFRVKSFCSVHNDNRYSDALISVSFDSTYKEYNVFGKVEGYNGEGKLYVKSGFRYEIGRVIDSLGNKYEITDNICMNGDEILAVITYVPVSANKLPVDCHNFGFDRDNNCYTFKQAILVNTAKVQSGNGLITIFITLHLMGMKSKNCHVPHWIIPERSGRSIVILILMK